MYIYDWQFSQPTKDHVDILPDTMHKIKTHIYIYIYKHFKIMRNIYILYL